jgi:hypothetical protein
VGPLVVVVADPEAEPVPGVVEADKLRPLEEPFQGRLPEPLDTARSCPESWDGGGGI